MKGNRIVQNTLAVLCIIVIALVAMIFCYFGTSAIADDLQTQKSKVIASQVASALDDYQTAQMRLATFDVSTYEEDTTVRDHLSDLGFITDPNRPDVLVWAADPSITVDANRIQQDSDGVWVYLIERGDNLSKLSEVFGHSVDALANYNEIRNVNLIYAESALRLPI